MRRSNHLAVACSLAFFAAANQGQAQTGSWLNGTSGNWSSAARWSGGVIANGPNNSAIFDLPLNAPVTVTLDTARTIGNLQFDNGSANNFSWTLRGTSTLTLSNSTTPEILVAGASLNANVSATLTTPLAGTQGFLKSGVGNLLLSTNNPGLSGGIDVSAGVLTISGGLGINPLGASTVTLSGGTLRLGSGGGFNQRMVVPIGTTFATSGITATMDGGTARTGDTWYELGQNVAAPATGVPMGQVVTSATNPQFQYTMQPATERHVLMLDNGGGNTTGRFTLTTPTVLPQVSFLTSSGNGVGNVTATLHYSDGTTDATGLVFTSADWFNATPVAVTASGRIGAGGYNNVGTTNPRLYDAIITNPNAASPISSIDLSWTGGANTHTAIFAINTSVLNGDPAQNFNNNVVVTADSTIDVRAVAGGTLGNVTLGANILNITGITGTTLGLGAVNLTDNGTISPAAGVSVNAGAVSDGGAVRVLTKAGDGRLALTAASPGLSSGTIVNVNAGDLAVNNATALGALPIVTMNAGQISLGASTTFNSLAGSSGLVNLNGNALTLSGGTATFSGAIANGTSPGSLIKAGAGIQTLSGASSFTGGAIVGGPGKLVLTNPAVLGSNTITLTGNGTLSVAGTPAVNIAGFNGNGTGWTQNGNAQFLGGDVLQITDNVGGQTSSVWRDQKVSTSSFTMGFQYTVPAASAPPADGMTIAFQNQGLTAISTIGGGSTLGYEGITPSAALAINIYPPNTTGGVGSGIKSLINGQAAGGNFLPIAPVDPGLIGTPTDVAITYDGTNIVVTFTQGANTFSTGPVPLDITGAVGGQAFIGFTGATGGATAQQQITNFSYDSPAQATYRNDVIVAAGSNPTIEVAATGSVFNLTMGALSLGSNSTLNVAVDAGSPANQAFGLTFGATTLTGNNTINVGTNGSAFGSVTLGSVGGGGTLFKTGNGQLILPSAGTYSGGTTVLAGRLIVTNTTGSATGTGAVNVNGGTLGGTGTIGGNVFVNSGGRLEPGSPLFPATAPGALRVDGNVAFNGGSYVVKLNGAGLAGTDYDQLSVGGAVSFGSNNSPLVATLGYAPSAADTLTIIQGGTVSPGQFQGLANNSVFFVGTFAGQPYSAQIQYLNSSVILTGFAPVPEPAHILLASAGIAMTRRWRRKRAA